LSSTSPSSSFSSSSSSSLLSSLLSSSNINASTQVPPTPMLPIPIPPTPIPPTSIPPTLSILPLPLHTSPNVKLSKENGNWITPYGVYNTPCYRCGYFGHSATSCQNTKEEYLSACFKCGSKEHRASDCDSKSQGQSNFFKDGYINPDHMLMILLDNVKKVGI
jgi:hypothetical protein